MAAAESGESRRIVVRRTFWTDGGLAVTCSASRAGSNKVPGHHGHASRHRDAVEKIAARDRALHAKFAIS
jgi:hypothetical protein